MSANYAYGVGMDRGARGGITLNGATGQESMRAIAEVIGLNIHFSESKAGTLIVLTAKPDAPFIKGEVL